MIVRVEYLNVASPVRKPNGENRLVASFGDVAQYCEPSLSFMPNVESVLHKIGKLKWVIATNIVTSYYHFFCPQF